jgi:predicted NBD/HSP70 family sugar kinase
VGVHHGHILRMLRDDGPQSRITLARRSNLSATTLTHLTAELLRDGIVTSAGTGGSASVGRPAQAICLVADAFNVAGVHVGAGHVQIAITDLTAAPKALTSFTFDPSTTAPETIVDRVAAAVTKLAAKTPAKRLLALGMGVPGPVDASRRKVLASINVGWKNVAFADMLEAALKLPVAVEHNVSAMALAETRYGIGRAVPALLYVYARTGIGAGLTVDGMPFRPGGHGAVELGHIQIARKGARCACGNTGCLETFLGERALMRAAGLKGVAPDRLLEKVARSRGAWNAVVGSLTTALASAVNLLTPDLIVFGGHLGDAPETLFARLRADLPPRVMPHMRGLLRIERASFGVAAGAIGGASVALDHFFYSGAFQ